MGMQDMPSWSRGCSSTSRALLLPLLPKAAKGLLGQEPGLCQEVGVGKDGVFCPISVWDLFYTSRRLSYAREKPECKLGGWTLKLIH